jgi:hypothetical protein
MLTKQAQALHEERQKMASEKNALEVRFRMLEERVQFLEASEAHGVEGPEAHDAFEAEMHEDFEILDIEDHM